MGRPAIPKAAIPKAAFQQWPQDVEFGLLGGLVGYAIRRAQIAIYRDFDLAIPDLTPPQVAALILIDANPGMNQTRLGAVMGVNRATIMALIDRLVAQGLVRRAPSVHDKRANELALTPRGKRRLEKLIGEIGEHDRRISRRLSATDITRLRALLEKLG